MKLTVAKPLILAALVAMTWTGCSTIESSSNTGDKVAPSRHLAVPADSAERDYLGLSSNTTNFTLCDLEADLLFVDLFDMYCHVCQTSAKHVNELYELVEARGMSDKIKFVGLGVGNTPMETTTFKRKFKMPFPVFPDRKGHVTKSLGDLRVPALLVLRKEQDALRIIHRSKGVSRDVSELLDHVLEDAAVAVPADQKDNLHGGQPICDEDRVKCEVPSETDQ